MSITPKNWSAFQHYKDRSPAWIKLHRGLLDDYEYNCLPLASRALAPMLWLLASEYEGGAITATFEALAYRLRITVKELDAALRPLIERGFFVDDSGLLAPCKRDASLEKRDIENIEKTEGEKNIGRSQATRPDFKFEEFKKVYPKRKGGNPWKSALSEFSKLVRAGADADEIIAAAREGVGYDRDQIGTSYIPQAVKWLRDERFRDRQAPAAAVTQGVYVSADTPQMDAWMVHERSTGKGFPRDRNGGWHFPSEYPPEAA